MVVKNLYHEGLAQASYLVGCGSTGEAIVVDPLRDIEPYLRLAKSQGLKIVATAETHIHADYLSGTRELAAATGAQVFLSDEGDATWQYENADGPGITLVKGGDSIDIGELNLEAIATPGHTPEHLAFLLTDRESGSHPHSLFAGDFVFVGDVGRPDLLERAAKIEGTMEKGARDLFHSLAKLAPLPDFVLMWPGHGPGSACGKALGGSPVSSLGYERRTNWAFLAANEDAFVDEILSGQPEPPRYFKDMKRLNKLGATILGSLPRPGRIREPQGQIVDIRPDEEVLAGSYAGSLAMPLCKSFVGYAGWMLDYDKPVTLISDDSATAEAAARDLALIGIDSVAGWVSPADLDASKFEPIQSIDPSEIRSGHAVLDVRGANERHGQSVSGSMHIPFGQLADRLNELPRDRPLVVHCVAGGRSMIAYSILRDAGFDVSDLTVGLHALEVARPDLVSIG